MRTLGFSVAAVCFTLVLCLPVTAIEDDSLVLYLSFNEGAGEVAKDGSGNGHDGVLRGGTEWVDGIRGKALFFDGEDDFVEVEDYIPLDDRPFTVEAWIRRDAMQQHAAPPFDMIVTQTEDYVQSRLFHLAVRNTNTLTFDFYGNGVDSKGTVALEEWQHIAGVYTEDGRQRVFINGVFDNERAGVASYAGTAGSILIGTRVPGPDRDPHQFPMDGIIDEVAIYHRALSEEEIQEDMNAKWIVPLAVSPSGKLATTLSAIKARF